MKRILAFLSIIPILLLAACELFDGNLIGPCVHSILDPLIKVEHVTDETTGHVIYSFKIVKAAVDDQDIPIRLLLNEHSTNSVLVDSVLLCNTPCAFGGEPGLYRLNIASIGYRDTTLVFDAQYARGGGNCPSYSAGSTVISFRMNKN